MHLPPIRADEIDRQAALAEYGLAGDDGIAGLDNVVALARTFFDVPIALVSLVDDERQFFTARLGLDVCETSRDVSFCAHALGSDDVMVVPDARLDPRFADNPLVTGDPHIRFYAGAPLRAPSGHVLGTLCIIDRSPRSGLSEGDRENLKLLARLVLDRLEIRRLENATQVSQTRFQCIADTSPDGIVCTDQNGVISFWNEAATRLFGFTANEAVGRNVALIIPQAMRVGHGSGMARVVMGDIPKLVGRTIELEALHQDGGTFPIELSLSMWRDGDQASFGAIARDITERRAHEERLYRLAHFDALTGLPNRGVLLDRITECIARAEPAAVLLLDLDGFKDVNDTLGHAAGDLVLKQVAERITACLRPIDTVARLGGDEFAVLIPDMSAPGAVEVVAEAINEALARPYPLSDEAVNVSASIGVALRPLHADTPGELLAAADLAMYQAKADGRHRWRLFAAPLRDAALLRRGLENEMLRAFEQGEFELFYQPQVRMAGGALIGAEALLRWRHPDQGLLSPANFLGALESGRLAPQVGRWIMETACAQAAIWRKRQPSLTIGVNLFGAQIRDGRLVEDVADALARAGLPASALELEVTENIILAHDDATLEPLRALRVQGVGIAFDDFGTGYASLSLLKRFPLTRIKIDRSFVQDICRDKGDAAIVRAMVHIGTTMRIEVIAEGVETAEQRDFLRASGCDLAQGYLFGAPVPAATFADLLTDRAVA